MVEIKSIVFFILAFLGNILYAQSNKEVFNENTDKLYPSKSIVSHFHNNWTREHYARRIESFKREPLNIGEIVFIGNSITEQGGDWSNKFGIKNIRNRGVAGDLTHGVLKRLDEIIYYKPTAVFILIGVNDLFNIHHERDTILKYDKIVPSINVIGKNILKIAKQIKKRSPKTKLFVRTILPTKGVFMKEDIMALNEIIKENESEGFYIVVDLHSQFVNSEGLLAEDYTNDGVHLNDKGYDTWVKFEKTIIEEL